MNNEEIKQYYERIEKLLNGASKETYGFAPEEIRQILRWYEDLQNNWNELKKMLEEYIQSYDNRMCLPFVDIKRLSKERMLLNNVLEKMQELEGKSE